MNEKILLESKQYNLKKFLLIMTLMIIALWFVFAGSQIIDGLQKCSEGYKAEECYHIGFLSNKKNAFHETHPNFWSYVDCVHIRYFDDIYLVICSGIALGLEAITVFIYFWLSKCSITVTDKRIFGKAAFGKRVDLPLDKVSAVGTSGLKGISIGTSSGKICFKLIKNQLEIHKTLSDLLVGHQPEKTVISTPESTAATSSADELKKFKDLLDTGAITEEEYNAKKKQILGL